MSEMKQNNGKIFDYTQTQVITEFSKCTYFFTSTSQSNYLKSTYKNKNIFGFNLNQKNKKLVLTIQIPSDFECYHYFKGTITQQTTSTPNTHLTYHGNSIKKKQSGEIHLKVDGKNTLRNRTNILEAPVAFSNDINLFPLPICRFELSEEINPIVFNKNISNYFELLSNLCFFNTLDVYIAKSGYMMGSLSGLTKTPEIALSMFSHSTLEGFKYGKLIRRRGKYPQIVILQIKDYELIIISMQEAQNEFYKQNKLHYFHSRNYFKKLFDRNALQVDDGYLIDFEPGCLVKKDKKFFKIIDII